jgi:hypothetical protein
MRASNSKHIPPNVALEIYTHKLRLLSPHSYRACFANPFPLKGQSELIAQQYGVAPKTVRDIWNRRSWTNTTYILWIEEASIVHNRPRNNSAFTTDPFRNDWSPPAEETHSWSYWGGTHCSKTDPLYDDWLYWHRITPDDDPFHDDWQHW